MLFILLFIIKYICGIKSWSGSGLMIETGADVSESQTSRHMLPVLQVFVSAGQDQKDIDILFSFLKLSQDYFLFVDDVAMIFLYQLVANHTAKFLASGNLKKEERVITSQILLWCQIVVCSCIEVSQKIHRRTH